MIGGAAEDLARRQRLALRHARGGEVAEPPRRRTARPNWIVPQSASFWSAPKLAYRVDEVREVDLDLDEDVHHLERHPVDRHEARGA